ncbi:hypothetical protein [Acidisphaera sp. L21]|jgi:hypothetical protein|uniref:hypothetical protein n=1 Tax=Acidisphaera sp. L21 TaxID=1641851 RepID=UPI00131A8331|nr:hypothetical protein [Acidisphaera sp. L21]
MIANSTSPVSQFTTKALQNSLTADTQAAETPQVAAAILPQKAIDEFALRFNAAMIEMLTAEDVSPVSPLSKKLRAYTTAGVAPVQGTSRFV